MPPMRPTGFPNRRNLRSRVWPSLRRRGNSAECAGVNGMGSFSALLPRAPPCHSASVPPAARRRIGNSPRWRPARCLWACHCSRAPVARRMANVAVPWLTHFYQDVPGFFWFEEGYRRMLETLPRTSPSVFVEIGSFHGRSTAYLAVEALNRGIPVTIHCVDSWQFPTPSEGAEARRDFGQHLAPVAVLLGERFVVHAMRSDEASRKFDDGSVDVV